MFRTTEDLIPNRIRRLSAREQPVATIVRVDSDGDGDGAGDGAGQSRNLTFRDLENLSNKAAWFLDKNIQEEKFLYMGPSDIRYLIWVLAAMKTRKCVVFPSPGNTIPANVGLFSKVGANTLLHAPEILETLSPLLAATEDMVTPIVSEGYHDILSETEALVDAYPFDATFEEVRDVPFLGLHTSGTSGHPKPIYWTHAALATTASAFDPEVHDEAVWGPGCLYTLLGKGTVFNAFAAFHFGGISPLLSIFYCESTMVLPYPGTRLTPANITALLRLGKCTTAFLPPMVLEAMADYPFALEALSKLERVAYAGGAVNPTRGKELSKHIRQFFPIIASTEGGPSHIVFSGDNINWNTFKFVDVGQRMEEVAPGFYELVFPRTELTLRSNAYFHTFPHLETEYRTSDLFSPVEGQDGWWIYRGRADNWMTLSTGLKMDPTDMENIINSHPDVLGSLVTGSYRVRPCLLVELKQAPVDEVSRMQALDNLWPTIAKANEGMPKLGHIPRELIVFASESKPFFRASKGTVQRVLTVAAYSEEIDAAYAIAEESLLTGGLPFLESTETAHLVPLLTVLFSDVMHGKDGSLDSEEDLFAHGLDSLGISVAITRLKATLRNLGIGDEKLQHIKNQLVYKEATVNRLASAISTILSGIDAQEQQSEEETRNQLLYTYEQKLQDIDGRQKARPLETENTEHTVILTGSTGSVGSYILASLLARKDVMKVYCLNRGADAPLKQAASFRARGLPDLGAESSRVVFLCAALHSPQLGLSESEYNTLVQEATTILHNAFPVNFLLNLRAFEPQLQAFVNLLQLSANGTRDPSVFFVSSISAGVPATVREAGNSVIPEAVASPEEAKKLLHQGYAQSKYICERLLQTFASLVSPSGRKTKAAVLRVGQVCGPLAGTGTWNASEWAPSLVISSKFLGARPTSIGGLEIDWVPVDKLGDIVTELLISSTSSSSSPSSIPTATGDAFTVYNVMNPQTTPWEDLVSALDKIAPEAVSAEEWISRVEKSGDSSNSKGGMININENPALKLVDFYKQTMLGRDRGNVTTEKGNLLRASETARGLSRIERRDLERWMKGWGL